MRYGIDFGTTRTVIAEVDRGNYPVVNVTDTQGDPQEFIPTVVAHHDGKLLSGWDAEALDGVELTRSFKRYLSAPDVSAHTQIKVGDKKFPLSTVLREFATYVVKQLKANLADNEPIEIILGVPAHARSAQRLLTVDAFTRAGATVLGLVNEPSAAGFEYSHRYSRTLNTKRTSIIVFDLGGGTFDATLLRIDGLDHVVERSTGIARLGGDDFDDVLAGLVLSPEQLSAGVPVRTMDAIRQAKEQIKPQSRRILIDLPEGEAVVLVADFFEAATPLVESTVEALKPLLGEQDSLRETEIAGLYLVGGASALPLVARILRERFGRRVHRSPLPTASTAVGLAIAADPDSAVQLRDRLARRIGVFREEDEGATISFDELVGPEDSSTSEGEIKVTRNYQAAHNVGVFRYVEYSSMDDDSPGDFSVLAEVRVPFERDLRDVANLQQVEIARSGPGPLVRETITIDSDGVATIHIALDDGFEVTVQAEVGVGAATG
ncbi:Hsp70 family protein [Corynebacterium sp. S7]